MSPAVVSDVLALGKYAIDVEPIPPRNRNNREVHLVYLRHLKESVDTLREIVEEAKVERPLDRSLAFACRYTKHSQELLEYVFGTCPKVFHQQDKKHAHTPRKKQVTFEDQIATSSSNTHKHVEPMHTQKSNVPVPPSTGVNSCTDASGSQPRSILKKHRIPPAKSDSLKKVEDHRRTIRSSLKTTNRVDSSISSKRTVINSNSHSVCQTCNKCLFSANHDVCVVTYLHSVNASPNVKNDVSHAKQVWKPKQVTQVWKPKRIKQIWKPTGKTLNNVGYQWRPTGRTFTLSDQCPLTRFTKLTRMSAIACANQSEPNQHWGSNFPNSPSSSVFKCRSYKSSFVRFGNDHFGAIMGYGDYVIGESVISRVYYVEGLGHNLFSVGQFCDSDLEVAFRKHSCYVRDTDGVELLKGSRGSNLYTISVEDMMKSSPICLLSKASKNKSWLWHRRLNHLNFGTINDLARKDLVRGLPRLKFEKDHLCSACQLGKSKKHTHKPKTENTNLEVLNTLHMDLCGPMRVQTINGKKYILVIVDDYSRFTWVKFLRSKDETPAVVIKFLKQIQVGLNKTTVPRTPQQNGVVERRNRTLVEAARTIENLGKLQPTADIGIFVGYAPNRKGYRIYNKRTRQIMETIHVTFDELTERVAHVQSSPRPAPNLLTPGPISSGLLRMLCGASTIPYCPKSNRKTSNLQLMKECWFQDMQDEIHELIDWTYGISTNLQSVQIIALKWIYKGEACEYDIKSKPSKKHLEAVRRGISVSQGTFIWVFGIRKTHLALQHTQTQDHAGCQALAEVHLDVLILGDKLIKLVIKKQICTSHLVLQSEYIAMSGCVPKSYGCWFNYQIMGLHTIASLSMANAEQAPAMASPVRTDEQIVPRNRWVPIGKSNCYLNEEKSQRSPIFKIAVDILKQTNFFRAFTASSTIPAIYIQQFWDTIRFDSKAGSYKCQLDEQWFNLTQDTLRDALQITPVDNNRAFSSPPTPDTLVEFVNKLGGYPKEVLHLSNVTTNDMFQPWRALTTIINLCLTGKTSGFERPRTPVAYKS
ncbi:retrovirus-related pol polyprotein from transposon TNT 1-94 [Tanacetum coccineum]